MGNICAWRHGKSKLDEGASEQRENNLLDQFQLKKSNIDSNTNPNEEGNTKNITEGGGLNLDDLKEGSMVEKFLLEKNEGENDSKESKTTSENNAPLKEPEKRKSDDNSSYANETECNSEVEKLEQEKRESELLRIASSREKRLSVSAEAYGEWNKKKEDFTPVVHEKDEEEKEKIREALNESFLFSRLNERELEMIVNAFDTIQVTEGNCIINEGEDGDLLYVIDRGEVEIYKMKKIKKETEVNGEVNNEEMKEESEEKEVLTLLKSKDVFGELALLYNSPRAATAKALTDCSLWTLDRETFTYIIKDNVAKNRRMYEEILAQVSILKDMDPYERCKVADCLKSKTFKTGEIIINEGEEGDTFYMLVSGNAVATKDDKVIKRYTKGDYFGELALLKNQPRAATVKTEDACELMYMDRKSFKRLLGPVENILVRNMDNYKQVLNELGIDASCV